VLSNYRGGGSAATTAYGYWPAKRDPTSRAARTRIGPAVPYPNWSGHVMGIAHGWRRPPRWRSAWGRPARVRGGNGL